MNALPANIDAETYETARTALAQAVAALTNPGWLYVLSNAAMPGLIKIGRTAACASERAAQLSAATGVPFPFEIQHEARFFDAVRGERMVHASLWRARVNNAREFFRCNLEDAIAAIEEARTHDEDSEAVISNSLDLGSCIA